MSIRPVDYQIVMNRTSEMSKDTSFTKSKVDVQQIQFSEELQQKSRRDERQVTNTEKTQQEKIDNRQKGNRQSKGHGSERDETSSEGKRHKRDRDSMGQQGSRIDIRI